MPIPFQCPHCQTFTEVDDHLAGQSGPCAVCGKLITVPSLMEATYSPQVARDSRPSAGKVWLRVIVFGGVIIGSLAMAIGVISVFIGIAAPAISAARGKARRQACYVNLERIGQALQQYHDYHGSYPPAFIPDDAGKPMHSWRVLILPHLGEIGLYQQYDFNEPWDSPNNIRIASNMPPVFGCPDDPAALNRSETTYMVVVGPKTMFPGAESVSFQAVLDGLGSSIMVVEVRSSGVAWTKPEDVDFNKMSFEANTGSASDMGCLHSPNGAHALLGDGTVIYLTDDTTADTVKSMLTIDGDETVDPRVFESF